MKVEIVFGLFVTNLRGVGSTGIEGINFCGMVEAPALPRPGETIVLSNSIVCWGGEVVVEDVYYWLEDGVLKPEARCRPCEGDIDGSSRGWSCEDASKWLEEEVMPVMAKLGFKDEEAKE